MSGFSSARRPEDASPGAGAGASAGDFPDPWGVRRAENLLATLEGVLSARVVTTPLGEVSEIHVLAKSGLQPKQIVRNIESALLAQLGLKVDHRKISIAQTADVKPLEALEREAVRDLALQRTVLFEDLTLAPGRRSHRITLSVTLSCGGRTETAEEESSDTPRSRVEAAARVEECRSLASLARTNDTLSLSAHGGVSLSGNDAWRPNPHVGLRLSLPFADRGARRLKLRETETMLEEAMALHQKSVERATAEIVATQVELLRSRERLASTGAAIAAAREAVRLARLRYQAGFAPLADLLQAQTQLAVALLDQTALQDGERRSQVELLRRTGQLLRSSGPV